MANTEIRAGCTRSQRKLGKPCKWRFGEVFAGFQAVLLWPNYLRITGALDTICNAPKFTVEDILSWS